jgi:hypothetical protein
MLGVEVLHNDRLFKQPGAYYTPKVSSEIPRQQINDSKFSLKIIT